ncbi:MAG: pyroglutamyl-peptidase I [Phycisphaerae bacterium]|nr:pyroglutamyl-peptidase I [Phycisphaerae bacterium]
MPSALRVLLTGFEPFGGSPVNPSQLLVQRVASARVPGLQLHTDVLPVVGGTGAGSAWKRLLAAVRAHRPHAVVCFGEAHTRGAVSVERVAVNLRDYRVADNAGVCVADEAIARGGPAAYFATLPVHDMVRRANEAGVPCQLSLSAGAFLCNEVMYRVLRLGKKEGMPRWAGFVHLPQLPEQQVVRPDPAAPMALEAMERGTASMLKALTGLSTPDG